MPVWVSLLRAVNLGARNKVPMPVLRERLVEAGFAEVRTYVQSGNVVTRSAHRSPARVGRIVQDVVATHFGVQTPVVVRSPAQLADVLTWNPFPAAAAAEPKLVQVLHLTGEPDPDATAALLAADLGTDEVAARGLELVVRYGGGVHGSRADAAIRSAKLGVEGTARNWRTLAALVDLTG